MKFLAYIAFRFLIALFTLLPFRVMYLLSDLLRIIFKNVIRYRVSVIDKNLSYCFPSMSKKERLKIREDFYKNFIDIILESIKGLSINPNKLIKRYKFKNPEILDVIHEQDQHVIFFSQHYNNWEWAPICLGIQMKHHLIGVVKFLSNKYINNYMIGGRSGNNVSVIPTYQTARYFATLPDEDKTVGIVFIADQKPSGKEKSIELPFLSSKASFHAGAAKYAIKSGLPVYSIDVHRSGRGIYEIEVIKLAESDEFSTAEDLTSRFKENLESLIRKSPESWLWSHKRFKDFLSYS